MPAPRPRSAAYVAPEWFATALAKEAAGQCEEALDIVYDKLDGWHRAGEFAESDRFIADLPVESLSVRMILAAAVLTRPASHELPHRRAFFCRAWDALESRGRDVRKLLGNLEHQS